MASSKWGGDESKLPKWAQQELEILRNHRNALTRDLLIAKRMAPLHGATGKIVADYLVDGGFPLNDRAMIKFQVGPLKYDTITCCLRERGYRTILDVNAQSGRLIIHPHAANCADLLVGD